MTQDITSKDEKKLSFREKLAVNFYDLAGMFAWGLVIVMLIFSFGFKVVSVDGESMLPTLEHGDVLLVTAFDPEPQYGEVVILTHPNYFDEPIVKRIIATENQVVDIDFTTGDVFVDGVLLDEPYINNQTLNSDDVTFPVTVPEGHVFVLGDNRQGSTDSRSTKVGFVREEYIFGVAKLKVLKVIPNENDPGKKTFKLNDFSKWKVE